jgi:hypothetical protein
MISRATAKAVVGKLKEWCERNGVVAPAMEELLLALAEVPGNTSFRDSIPLLLQAFREGVQRDQAR